MAGEDQQSQAATTIPGELIPIVWGDPFGDGSPFVLPGDLIGGTLRERMHHWELVWVLRGAVHRSVVRIGGRLSAESNPAG